MHFSRSKQDNRGERLPKKGGTVDDDDDDDDSIRCIRHTLLILRALMFPDSHDTAIPLFYNASSEQLRITPNSAIYYASMTVTFGTDLWSST